MERPPKEAKFNDPALLLVQLSEAVQGIVQGDNIDAASLGDSRPLLNRQHASSGPAFFRRDAAGRSRPVFAALDVMQRQRSGHDLESADPAPQVASRPH